MEGKIARASIAGAGCLWFSTLVLLAPAECAESAARSREQLTLHKAVGEREFGGKTVPGEERRIAPGDSLWRILVQEKGLPSTRFSRYVVIIRALNPQVGPNGRLRVGDMLFLPLQPDELLERRQAPVNSETQARPATGRGAAQNHVERGREPVVGSPGSRASASQDEVKGRGQAAAHHPTQFPARSNVALITRVAEALDGEVLRNGEEVVSVHGGAVRLDRTSFPLLYNRKLNQKVILDPEGKIPPEIRAKIAGQPDAPAILSLAGNMTVKQAVNELLARLGFQALSSDQPVMAQEGGLAFEARGDWTALGPEENNQRQEIFVVSLIDQRNATPEYLRVRLAALGLHLKEVFVSSTGEPVFVPAGDRSEAIQLPRRWPQEKSALVDALLSAYGIRFSRSEPLSVPVREGVSIDTVADRVFHVGSRRTAIFFRALESELKEILQQAPFLKPVELDFTSLSSHAVIRRVVSELGEEASYREHRFSAARGRNLEKLIIGARGFLLAKPGLFVTDHEIPTGYHSFFFDRGLAIVYFR